MSGKRLDHKWDQSKCSSRTSFSAVCCDKSKRPKLMRCCEVRGVMLSISGVYKRHKDGTPISSEPERQHVMQGAVERRSCVGVRLELSTEDRQGLLTGFFIDSGDGVTHVFPVVNGYSFPHLTKRMNVAAYLVDLLSRRGRGYFLFISVVIPGLEITIFVKNFTFSDGRVIKVGTKRFQARETLFIPLGT
ncbi:Actin-related protein 2 [Trifolium repens]|nr:Actin-related protein 2 [Trifolium repens]